MRAAGTSRWRSRRAATFTVLVLGTGLLSACGGDEGGPPTLNWYINNAAQGPIGEVRGGFRRRVQHRDPAAAERCGRTARAAASAVGRERLLDRHHECRPALHGRVRERRLHAAFTDEERDEFSEGVLKGPLDQAIFDDTMWSAPFYGNTQLLWFHKSVAEEAGLDMDEPVTWDQLIEAAEQTGTTMAVQGRKNESLMVWVNALVESAGGSILAPDQENVPAVDVEPTINSEAGADAARIMRKIADSSAAPPALHCR